MNLSVKKIELILPKKESDEILEEIQLRGLIEIIPGNSRNLDGMESDKEKLKLGMAETDFALSFLERFKPKESFLKNLILSFIPSVKRVSRNDFEKELSPDVRNVVKECARIEEKINSLEFKREKLIAETDVLDKFSGTSARSGENLEKINLFAGYINRSKEGEFLAELSKKRPFCLEIGKGDSFNFAFVLFYPKDKKSFFDKILKKYDAKEEIVFWKDVPERVKDGGFREISKIDLDIEILKKEAQKLLLFAPKLRALSDWFSWEMEKKNFLEKAEKTKEYLSIEAWVAAKDIGKLREAVKKRASHFLLKELPFSEKDNPPVIIENKGFLGSFAIVTGVYGLPKKNELDPTPYLTPFFAFYFALALSDSGYGLLLVALSLLAKKVFKEAGVDKFFNLFIIGGILTTIVGIFSGTVFGTDIAAFLRIADPISDPIGALFFVLLIGAFQIFAGLLIGAGWLIKKGKTKEAIAGNGASIVFFAGTAISFLTGNMAFLVSGIASMVLLAFLFSEEKNVLLRAGKGIRSIYGLVGYFSDILSYSRLLALGLATGIIAAVINMIALIFKDMMPFSGIGWLIAGLVLVIGHTANLLINALGAFIHSARLQFVEFFSKFMEGGGKQFKPLNKRGRFVEIIN